MFNTVDKIIGNAKYGGFKAQQDYYTVALLGKYYSDIIDLQVIWQTQSLPDNVLGIVPEIADFVWQHFQNPTVPGVNIGQWCKKEDCWLLLQQRYEDKYLRKKADNVQTD